MNLYTIIILVAVIGISKIKWNGIDKEIETIIYELLDNTDDLVEEWERWRAREEECKEDCL